MPDLIAVAMSGGVDSSVVTALLKREGPAPRSGIGNCNRALLLAR